MKLKQHVEIGNIVYDRVSKEYGKDQIYRVPFLIGNIAPDLNCVYPAHRLSTTEKRFYRRLKIATHTDFTVVRSFTLGVITHYICDYFCYAHNNESLGKKHKVYEENLWCYYKAHLEELKTIPDRIINEWQRNKEISINDNIVNDELKIEEQCQLILEQIKLMNNEYRQHTEVSRRKNWERVESQLQYDLQYIIFMANYIDILVIDPFKCITLA